MSEKKGFDPFADDNERRARSPESTATDEPMDHLFVTEEASDGWEPIAEETWEPAGSIGDLASLVGDGSGGSQLMSNSPMDFEQSAPRNLLPDEAVSEEAAKPPEAEPPAAEEAAEQSEETPVVDHHSNEAILQSGRTAAVSGVEQHGREKREKLPSRRDAPAVAVVVESRPISMVLPALVGVGGIGAGIYVCMGTSPILGSIAIALSAVGALFLRVLLKQ